MEREAWGSEKERKFITFDSVVNVTRFKRHDLKKGNPQFYQ